MRFVQAFFIRDRYMRLAGHEFAPDREDKDALISFVEMGKRSRHHSGGSLPVEALTRLRSREITCRTHQEIDGSRACDPNLVFPIDHRTLTMAGDAVGSTRSNRADNFEGIQRTPAPVIAAQSLHKH
jgi:hypothetical protein